MSQRSAWIAAAIATAEVSEPPRPSVVMRPVSLWMPWKPEITATSLRSLKRLTSSAPLTSRMRAEPCASLVRMGNCQPCHDRALTPISCSARARRPEVTCSPEATTASYSRASCSGAASRHHSTSRLVVPAMAETTTATSCPASISRFTWRATLRMRSISATDVPPNFMTRRLMRVIFLTFPAGKGGYTYRRCLVLATAAREIIMAERATGAAESTVDAAEVERFSRLAADWWDPRGPMAPLHKFNPVRLGYIRDQAVMHFQRDPKRLDCLKGLRILDIGCGAGLLSEPLARIGAEVKGADPAANNIEVAKQHAAEAGVAVD